MFIILCDLEAFHINATDYKSLQHSVNHAFVKIFATKSNDIILDYQRAFASVIYDSVTRRNRNLLSNLVYKPISNFVCVAILTNYAATEISQLREHVSCRTNVYYSITLCMYNCILLASF